MMFGTESAVRLIVACRQAREIQAQVHGVKEATNKDTNHKAAIVFGSVAWCAGYSAVPAGQAPVDGTIDSS